MVYLWVISDIVASFIHLKAKFGEYYFRFPIKKAPKTKNINPDIQPYVGEYSKISLNPIPAEIAATPNIINKSP